VRQADGPVPDRETVNHPPHYTNARAECIEIMEDLGFLDSYYISCAFKYIWRHRAKGKPLEDLRKAVWYLEREIERIDRTGEDDMPVQDFTQVTDPMDWPSNSMSRCNNE